VRGASRLGRFAPVIVRYGCGRFARRDRAKGASRPVRYHSASASGVTTLDFFNLSLV
jgi:hypothetical protein